MSESIPIDFPPGECRDQKRADQIVRAQYKLIVGALTAPINSPNKLSLVRNGTGGPFYRAEWRLVPEDAAAATDALARLSGEFEEARATLARYLPLEIVAVAPDA